MKEIKLEKFQGPLDLLLQLVDEEQMEITEISLSAITEQYWDYLSKMEEENLSQKEAEEMADFLVVAAKLVYLKSKHLLPYLYTEEDEGTNLSEQLKMYKRFIDASRQVEELWLAQKISYGREEPAIKTEEFILPSNANGTDLHKSFLDLMRRLKPVNPLPQAKIDRNISVREIVEHFKETLQKMKSFRFGDVLKNAQSRTEVIVSFLAILDLVRAGSAYIKQDGAFSDLEIRKV